MKRYIKGSQQKGREVMEEKFKESFIDFMIDSGVLTFGDFQTKSGRMSPYFINTGNYSTGEKISTLGSYYAKLIKKEVTPTILESGNLCLFGPAYKGIPLVVASSSALYEDFGIDLPYAFNRKEGKDHGEKGMIVGHSFQKGQSVLIIEDVVTAGTALREVVPFLMKQENVKIEGVIVSVDRMEKGIMGKSAVQEIQDEYGIPVFSLVTIREVLEILRDKKGHKISSPLNDARISEDKAKIPDDKTINKIEAYLEKYGV